METLISLDHLRLYRTLEQINEEKKNKEAKELLYRTNPSKLSESERIYFDEMYDSNVFHHGYGYDYKYKEKYKKAFYYPNTPGINLNGTSKSGANIRKNKGLIYKEKWLCSIFKIIYKEDYFIDKEKYKKSGGKSKQFRPKNNWKNQPVTTNQLRVLLEIENKYGIDIYADNKYKASEVISAYKSKKGILIKDQSIKGTSVRCTIKK